MKKLKNEMRWKMNKSMKRSWFKVPVKVKQINEYLFSDIVQSKKNKKWQWWHKSRSKAQLLLLVQYNVHEKGRLTVISDLANIKVKVSHFFYSDSYRYTYTRARFTMKYLSFSLSNVNNHLINDGPELNSSFNGQ